MTSPSPRPPEFSAPALPGRIPSLDGLRAVSIILVLIGHAAMAYDAPAILGPFRHLGYLGVRFFFIISGFLITTLLIKERNSTGTISLKGFYYRRSLRIFPASLFYLVVIAALWAWGIISLRQGDLLHSLTYTMNYHFVRSWWVDHLWSLSVEEQFYLIWPLLVVVSIRRAYRIAWAVVALVPVIRIVMLLIGASNDQLTKEFQATADTLATGCLLCFGYNWLSDQPWYARFQKSFLFWVTTLSLFSLGNALFVVHRGSFYVIGQTLANVGAVLCVDWCIRNPNGWVGNILNSRPFVMVGVLSYSLYLWQNPFLNPYLKGWASSFPINIALAFVAAAVSYYFVERPFLRLKGRSHAVTPESSGAAAS